MSRGTASGHVDVEQAARRAGLGADRRRRRSRGASGRRSGQELGRAEQHDREVLGQVAGILDRPVRVIAEGRVAGRLDAGTGSRTPAGRAGRSRRGCRRAAGRPGSAAPMPADQPRRHALPPAPTSSEERRRRRGSGSARCRPGRTGGRPPAGAARWRTGDASGRLRVGPRSPRAVGRSGSSAPGPRRARARREQREADRDDVGLVPGGRELGAVPEHGPEGEEDGRRERGPRPDVEAAEHPPADRDVDRGEEREQALVVGGESPDRHERQQEDRRQRRERQEARVPRRRSSRWAGRPGSRRSRSSRPSRATG